MFRLIPGKMHIRVRANRRLGDDVGLMMTSDLDNMYRRSRMSRMVDDDIFAECDF